MRPLGIAWAGALTVVVASAAAAPPSRGGSKAACISESEAAQKLRREGKLRSAREQLLLCARSECPVVVRQDCAQWLNEVVASTPSIVVAARDATGKETLNVKVTIDGEIALQKLDGKAMTLDPGVHAFKYEAEDGTVVEEEVGIREGEKNRVLTVTFQKPGAPVDAPVAPPAAAGPAIPPAPRSTTTVTTKPGVPVGAFVFGGLAVVGAGVGTFMLVSASSDASNLRSTCAPSCSHSEVNSARNKALIADVAFGAGAVSLMAALWMALSRPPERVETVQTAVRVDLTPLPGGGGAGVRGAF